ncbi:GNAT family N-acetyltransferase [Allorhizobium taibaishanense]|uniref:GNAT family N-acetyltransferase n=1 Tax=Allorhizobium taibaishanense TaxID=887144 RepID=A0A1Q9A3N2_9HYPH|nr:GNAT family N-acetyltransferase [Allorhizobium taibaishanense]MBB4006140.1 putative acetyltransferase [Allorhizobium taibaishanense]OLP49136.1 GNAT family N-acetyltransferase [Allorhizobium taibaishanense]
MPDKPAPSIAAASPVAANARWPDGLVIRAQHPDDAADIAALQSLPGVRAGTLRPPYPVEANVRKYIEDRQSQGMSLVAIMDGRVVGNAGLTQAIGRRSHAGSLGIAVHDAYHGRGIGRALIGELVAIADDWLNIVRLELTVFVDNAAAIALYESFGFTVEGTHRAFALRAGAFVDAYAMARVSALSTRSCQAEGTS